jgi:hypothetical protein
LLFLWAALSIPFIFVGAGELSRDGLLSPTVWAGWEGKGYVMFTLPSLVAALTLGLAQRPRERRKTATSREASF